jgi:hypothetical protein
MTREKEEIDLSVLCLDIIYAFDIEKEEEKKKREKKNRDDYTCKYFCLLFGTHHYQK